MEDKSEKLEGLWKKKEGIRTSKIGFKMNSHSTRVGRPALCIYNIKNLKNYRPLLCIIFTDQSLPQKSPLCLTTVITDKQSPLTTSYCK